MADGLCLLACLFELLCDLLALGATAADMQPGRSRPLEFPCQRARRLENLRRKRRLRSWLRQTRGKGPLPDIGLTCGGCHYALAGLERRRCPECGQRFDLRTLAGWRRKSLR